MTTHETDDPPELASAGDDEDLDDTGEESDESVLLTESATGSVLPPEDEAADEPQATDAAAVDETSKPSPLDRLEPVAPDAVLDPGSGSFRDRWTAIQTGFIDDPARAVASASGLVAEMWDGIEQSVAAEREAVDRSWQTSERSTDDLRAVMQSYRALCTRLMSFTDPA